MVQIGRIFIEGGLLTNLSSMTVAEILPDLFNREYRRKYDETLSGLLGRGILTCIDGKLFTTVAA